MADNTAPATTTTATGSSVPANHNVISQDLESALASLAQKHVTISYTLVGVIVVILILVGVGAYFGNKSWQAAMSRAEASEKQMDADRTQYQQTLAQMQKQIDQNNAQIQQDQVREAQLVAQISQRDKQADTQISNVLQPGKTATDAFSDLASAYKGVVSLTQDIVKDPTGAEQFLAFPVPAVQQFTAAELSDQRDSKDLADTKSELSDEQDKSAKLTDSLNQTTASLTALQTTEKACEATVTNYKKVAKKSRFRRIMGGVEKVGLFAAGVFIGHKL